MCLNKQQLFRPAQKVEGDSLLNDTKMMKPMGHGLGGKNPLGIEGVIHFGTGLMT